MTFDLSVPNVGHLDRALRGIAGTLLVAWAALGGPAWAWLGLLPLATAVMRFCPVYALLGLHTCEPPGPGPKL